MGEQTFLQVRVDAALKDDAMRVLDRIGMDMPNAIRMFLKRVVIEGGLPFEAKFPVTEEIQTSNISDNKKCVVYIPAVPAVHVPMQEYIDLILMVPAGKITRREDIEKYLAKKHNAQRIEIDMHPLFSNPFWEGIPIWREVSTRGMLRDTRHMSRDRQRELLEADGLKIVPCGANKASLKVDGYKNLLYDFKNMED